MYPTNPHLLGQGATLDDDYIYESEMSATLDFQGFGVKDGDTTRKAMVLEEYDEGDSIDENEEKNWEGISNDGVNLYTVPGSPGQSSPPAYEKSFRQLRYSEHVLYDHHHQNDGTDQNSELDAFLIQEIAKLGSLVNSEDLDVDPCPQEESFDTEGFMKPSAHFIRLLKNSHFVSPSDTEDSDDFDLFTFKYMETEPDESLPMGELNHEKDKDPAKKTNDSLIARFTTSDDELVMDFADHIDFFKHLDISQDPLDYIQVNGLHSKFLQDKQMFNWNLRSEAPQEKPHSPGGSILDINNDFSKRRWAQSGWCAPSDRTKDCSNYGITSSDEDDTPVYAPVSLKLRLVTCGSTAENTTSLDISKRGNDVEHDVPDVLDEVLEDDRMCDAPIKLNDSGYPFETGEEVELRRLKEKTINHNDFAALEEFTLCGLFLSEKVPAKIPLFEERMRTLLNPLRAPLQLLTPISSVEYDRDSMMECYREYKAAEANSTTTPSHIMHPDDLIDEVNAISCCIPPFSPVHTLSLEALDDLRREIFGADYLSDTPDETSPLFLCGNNDTSCPKGSPSRRRGKVTSSRHKLHQQLSPELNSQITDSTSFKNSGALRSTSHVPTHSTGSSSFSLVTVSISTLRNNGFLTTLADTISNGQPIDYVYQPSEVLTFVDTSLRPMSREAAGESPINILDPESFEPIQPTDSVMAASLSPLPDQIQLSETPTLSTSTEHVSNSVINFETYAEVLFYDDNGRLNHLDEATHPLTKEQRSKHYKQHGSPRLYETVNTTLASTKWITLLTAQNQQILSILKYLKTNESSRLDRDDFPSRFPMEVLRTIVQFLSPGDVFSSLRTGTPYVVDHGIPRCIHTERDMVTMALLERVFGNIYGVSGVTRYPNWEIRLKESTRENALHTAGAVLSGAEDIQKMANLLDESIQASSLRTGTFRYDVLFTETSEYEKFATDFRLMLGERNNRLFGGVIEEHRADGQMRRLKESHAWYTGGDYLRTMPDADLTTYTTNILKKMLVDLFNRTNQQFTLGDSIDGFDLSKFYMTEEDHFIELFSEYLKGERIKSDAELFHSIPGMIDNDEAVSRCENFRRLVQRRLSLERNFEDLVETTVVQTDLRRHQYMGAFQHLLRDEELFDSFEVRLINVCCCAEVEPNWEELLVFVSGLSFRFLEQISQRRFTLVQNAPNC